MALYEKNIYRINVSLVDIKAKVSKNKIMSMISVILALIDNTFLLIF